MHIRNPWGNFEWQGDWGDSSSLWTEELIKAVGATFGDDGAFYMSYEDFLEHFNSVQVCLTPNGGDYEMDIFKTQMTTNQLYYSAPCNTNIFTYKVDDNMRWGDKVK